MKINPSKKKESEEIRIVDLFCGAGGLSCGFDHIEADVQFKTVLGIDNEPSAIRVFNSNFLPELPNSSFNVGRTTDVTWFTHSAEIRLFYLVHLAFTSDQGKLKQQLSAIGLDIFLAQLRYVDKEFNSELYKIYQQDEYSEAVFDVPKQTFSLALPKVLLGRLGLNSFARPQLALSKTPWTEEYTLLDDTLPVLESAQKIRVDSELVKSAETLWEQRIQEINAASERTGRGQHKKNSSRLSALSAFLRSPAGHQLKNAWIGWRSKRDSIRAQFCLEQGDEIRRLYLDEHRVHIVLGGPPCKGFSRIGRPVIQSLRDQGVHAWSHHEYGDERNALMCQYVLFLEALSPDVFLFENVANFQSALRTPSGVFDAPTLLVELIDAISDSVRYAVDHRVLNARNFGVPQDRRRFIMFGVRENAKSSDAVLREFFDLSGFDDDVTLNVALDGLATAVPFQPNSRDQGEVDVYQKIDERMPAAELHYRRWIYSPEPLSSKCTRTTTGHIYRSGREDDRSFVDYVAPGIRWMDLKPSKSPTLKKIASALNSLKLEASSSHDLKELNWLRSIMDDSIVLRLILEHNQIAKGLEEQHLLLEGYLKNGATNHGDWFERLSATKPSKTIVAHIGKDTYGYWHPYERRALSIREAARVQSFPDWFKLSNVGIVDAYTAIGNAVPPLMANSFAKKLSDLHIEYSLFSKTELDDNLVAAE